MKDASGNTLYPQTLASLIEGLSEVISGNDSITTLEALVEKLDGEDSVEGSVKAQIKAAIDGIVDGAPEAFDTLKEIAKWLENSDDATAEDLVASTNANKTAIGTKATDTEAATGIYKDIDDLNTAIEAAKDAATSAHSAVAETADTEELKGNPTVTSSTDDKGKTTYTIAGGILYVVLPSDSPAVSPLTKVIYNTGAELMLDIQGELTQ